MERIAKAGIADDLKRVAEGRHHAPFEVLGRHDQRGRTRIRTHLPGVDQALLEGVTDEFVMQRIPGTDLFEWQGDAGAIPEHYAIRWDGAQSGPGRCIDPYSFVPAISDFDLHLFGIGRHWHVYRILGAWLEERDGVTGVRFATWAPNAERVSVVGDFNHWDGRRHPMHVHGSSGVWELFIPDVKPGALYKFELRNRNSGAVFVRADPYGRSFEHRPDTASIVEAPSTHLWHDGDWLAARAEKDWQHSPMSVYEVHLGSWLRGADNEILNYRALAHRLVDYTLHMGFTHIELLPITEHPLDESWGYQTTGYFAPTSRYGTPDDFRYFVDLFHQHGIGVLLDWVPAHFPRDEHALARFDGTPLYEHSDPRRGEHRDWGTYIYNFGRNEVRNFLLASANFWVEEMHIDGLRVDAVASMLYLDYSREDGDWVPNIYGGNENLEAIDFLRELNTVVQGQHPGSLVIAEESTAWPQVTRPTWVGGLGFSMKWNMGWMHDTLSYLSHDPVHRHYHHDMLTFGLLYAFSENFMLPFSHDEVVHGKGSMIGKMPGDEWQRFANLRLLYTYMFTYPGTKLLFMGNEFGQWPEWSHQRSLEWDVLQYPLHHGLQDLVRDLNHLYRDQPALHQRPFSPDGFEWIDCHDSTQSVISYLRHSPDGDIIVVLNFTPVPRFDYRLGVNAPGRYRELFNSDSTYYAGSNLGNGEPRQSEPLPWMGRDQSISLTLPPLGGIILSLEPGPTDNG